MRKPSRINNKRMFYFVLARHSCFCFFFLFLCTVNWLYLQPWCLCIFWCLPRYVFSHPPLSLFTSFYRRKKLTSAENSIAFCPANPVRAFKNIFLYIYIYSICIYKLLYSLLLSNVPHGTGLATKTFQN